MNLALNFTYKFISIIFVSTFNFTFPTFKPIGEVEECLFFVRYQLNTMDYNFTNSHFVQQTLYSEIGLCKN